MNETYFNIFDDCPTLEIPKEFTREPPRTAVMDEFVLDGTRHEAVVPTGGAYEPLPREPRCDAKHYKFELDEFQKLSIASIEKDETVLVSAHTSCGKTVVAEYAIAQALQNRQRVIYTSPIKALSNQKYRELQEEFGDVGLMTGDVTIGPEASCLVMTTEILRNMLYRGSEIIREVHWVIFDEIHYMRDRERGVVWEEAIILLPGHVRMVFLSATIPNAREFAEWIATIQKQAVHVVSTDRRVVPLVHYVRTDGTYLVKDTRFHLREFNLAMGRVPPRKETGRLLQEVLEEVDTPAVVFSFSRKDCEDHAIRTRRDFLTEDNKEQVRTIFENAVASLRPEDRCLPLIERMLPLLLRGVGIHHSGLLPIIREVVELLFQESLIRVLFATETFAIGLNMPAKTVIFTSLRKFDGTSRRLLTPGEFIQMSGRAGRRGIDEKGVAICILTEELTEAEIRGVFSSQADRLVSAFRLTYNMVLNLLRVEGLDAEYLLGRSFFHYQKYREAIEEERKISDLINSDGNRSINNEEKSKNLINLLTIRESLNLKRSTCLVATFRHLIQMKGRVVGLRVPCRGSLLLIHNAVIRDLTGDVLRAYVLTDRAIELKKFAVQWICDVYDAQCKADLRVFSRRFPLVAYHDETTDELADIEREIGQIAPELDLEKCLFCGRGSKGCLSSDCLTSGKCSSKNSPKSLSEISSGTDIDKNKLITNGKFNNEINDAIKFLHHLAIQDTLADRIANLNHLKEIYHMEECRKMVAVLSCLGYIDDASVLIKGKTASEISAGDELVLTELLFSAEFTALSLVQMVALLSCCVCEESVEGLALGEENDKAYALLANAASRVASSMAKCGLPVQEDEFLDRFSYAFMDTVKLWMTGRTFLEVCEASPSFEGSIIRMFKRLEELLRQLASAAAVMGNNELVNQFTQGIFLIKRDIVFANSLYL